MSPVNVKLPASQLRRLDRGIALGRAANRSDALRIALEQLLNAWEREAWAEKWAQVIPDVDDEFVDLQPSGFGSWTELDGDL